MRDLDELRELRDACGLRNVVAASRSPGQPLPSHCSYAAPTAAATASSSELFGERAARSPRDARSSCRRPGGRQTANSTPIRNRRSERVARAEPANAATAPRAPCNSWSYLVAFKAMSSPNHLACSCASVWQPTLIEQRRVVHGRPVGLVEPDPLRDPQRDQALAQDVLHRLPEAEVDPERQRRDELGEPERGVIALDGSRRDRHPTEMRSEHVRLSAASVAQTR